MKDLLQANRITPFAETDFRNRRQRFGIKREDRRGHMYVLGKTGMGKSTLLENMIASDLYAGNGIAVIDPHGDLIDRILGLIPKSRVHEVIYFNPADLDYPIAFNVLENVAPRQRHLVASGLISVFKKIWPEFWGPRMEYILKNSLLTLLEFPNSTLLWLPKLLAETDFRSTVVSKLTSPHLRGFWTKEFASFPVRLQTEMVSPIQNKAGQFLSTPLARNIVGQIRNTFHLREVMDKGEVFLANLSKGQIGEDMSALLGAMLVSRIELTALSRADVPEQERRDFYLYVDEFPNFATESFASTLSEARKYRLNLILAHQYISQLKDEVRDAVFGNVGTLIAFRVGARDAEYLAKEVYPVFTAEDLQNLPRYKIYLKLQIDGVTSQAFSARTLAPFKSEKSRKEEIIKRSREVHATHIQTKEFQSLKPASTANKGQFVQGRLF